MLTGIWWLSWRNTKEVSFLILLLGPWRGCWTIFWIGIIVWSMFGDRVMSSAHMNTFHFHSDMFFLQCLICTGIRKGLLLVRHSDAIVGIGKRLKSQTFPGTLYATQTCLVNSRCHRTPPSTLLSKIIPLTHISHFYLSLVPRFPARSLLNIYIHPVISPLTSYHILSNKTVLTMEFQSACLLLLHY